MNKPIQTASIRNGFDFGDSTPAIKYNMDDHLGSSNLSVDENGTLVNREEYYPFGETSFGSYSKKSYRFCGKEKDEESGLYYYGARYYSPWTCRFISVDPLAGKYAQLTAYNYAGNEPIGDKDVDGMQSEKTDTAQTSAPTPSSPPASNQTAGTNINCHKVQSGETLSGIAKKNGISVDALRKANNLDPKNDKNLDIGTELDIPAMEASKIKNDRKLTLNEIKMAIDRVSTKGAKRFMLEFEKTDSNKDNAMQTSEKGRAFLIKNEGSKSKLYNDSKGHATIGVGHLVHKGKIDGTESEIFKKGLSPIQIDALLTQDLKKFEKIVNSVVKVPLNQEQFDAIISFTFNVGGGSAKNKSGLLGSLFLEQLNKGNYNGKLLMNFHRPSEIIPRRQREVNLFNSNNY